MTRSLDALRRPQLLAAAALAVTLAGCKTVGPDYTRPATSTPDSFRGADPTAVGRSIGEESWAAVFPDDVLRQLIAEALANNLDARIAATRILQAAAQLGVTRADQLPTVTGQLGAQGQRGAIFGGTRVPTIGVAQASVGLSWEIDFWGRYRRATEAAQADLARTEWGQRAIVTSLVSEVASQYFVLRALDLQLEIATRTLASRQESLRLTELRERGGATPLVDVRQAEQLVLGARAQMSDVQGSIAQVEHALSLLLGRVPGPIARGQALIDQPRPPVLPAGLPAALLERRPDVRQAEQQLVAATARIGVAESFRYPQIGLTGSGGVASTSLANLLSSGTWSIGTNLVQPIFNAGRNRNRVALAEAEASEAALVWQRAVLQALRETSDALVGYARQREVRTTQEALVVAAADARRLADLRYRGGATSYLEVLDSETRLYVAELGLVQARLAELTAYVEVYRALGGGWTS
ncbi:RND transporter [Luteitalea sp. TBR-22]|uniref:efflux transporter outer membrane subunit n=1 Tax=Luteitalea sp. TBR-22 TaxID=2802971 RepID=UPI001AF27F1E|nr:efflux transporter outer membrane subunit [Luteitalea sp. TBR-22]BCS32137.1 RND transporter [Luteitalea sp. TBR-22]